MDFAVFGCEPLGCSALLGSKNSLRNWSVSVLDSGSATVGTGNWATEEAPLWILLRERLVPACSIFSLIFFPTLELLGYAVDSGVPLKSKAERLMPVSISSLTRRFKSA